MILKQEFAIEILITENKSSLKPKTKPPILLTYLKKANI